VNIIRLSGIGFTTLVRFIYWILCETVLPGQGGVPRLAEVDFTNTEWLQLTMSIFYVVCFRLLLYVMAPAYYVNLLRSLFSVAPLCKGSSLLCQCFT
jgi:hypothetical protein